MEADGPTERAIGRWGVSRLTPLIDPAEGRSVTLVVRSSTHEVGGRTGRTVTPVRRSSTYIDL